MTVISRTVLNIALRLPPGQYETTLDDLDRQHTENQIVAADGTLELGTTDHDFGLVLKRR